MTDTVKATFRLASGDGDPRSTNQTLTNIASPKQIWIDQAYTDWNFMNGGNLVLGKQPYPFFRPGQSLFYDGDFNPEGAAVKLDRGMFFGSAYWWWLQENYNASPTGNNEDANLWGLQGGMKFALLGGETKLAASTTSAVPARTTTRSGTLRRQSTTPSATRRSTRASGTTAINVLKYGYDVLELSGQMDLTVFDLPLLAVGGLGAEHGFGRRVRHRVQRRLPARQGVEPEDLGVRRDVAGDGQGCACMRR